MPYDMPTAEWTTEMIYFTPEWWLTLAHLTLVLALLIIPGIVIWRRHGR